MEQIKKQRKAVDIDDSLFDFISEYIAFNNLKYKTNLKKEDFKSYRFNEFRGGTMQEAVNSVKEFCYGPFFEKVQPFPNAIEVIKQLKEKNELFIVTSRPIEMKELTFKQISRYFPNTFYDIIFSSNHYTGAKNNGETKAEICKKIGASLLIDDSLVYAKQCIENGIEVMLLDSPWNQNGCIQGIKRVKNWKEIGELLK
jgi:uncharacterized HAD superfamily protein